ncbi:DUF5954 family protein [Streptomyces sp. MCAF7]
MVDDWKRHLDALHEELVRRDDPVAWVTEADAVNASRRYPYMALRGPVFGIAVQEPAVGPDWRLLLPVVDGMPQQARDGLEPPRPTDREPVDRTWGVHSRTPSPDRGFVLDPGQDGGLIAGALKLGLRDFAYADSDSRFPAEVRADSERAVAAYPDIVLLPVGFGVVERDGKWWRPRGAMMATPHEARDLLYGAMTDTWPVLYQLDEHEKAEYIKAAEEFKAAGHANDARVGDRLYRICRIERLVRCGPDGPEPPRRTDVDEYGPSKMHPTMSEDGSLHYD